MKYHDNKALFSSNNCCSVVGGQYTIDEFCISDKQDPNGNIKKGLKVEIKSNGNMTFKVGRHKTKQVADWFNTISRDGKDTTFQHDAGGLNFAFKGTLNLKVVSILYGNKTRTYTFENVLIAQGSTGDRNNWWFGGSKNLEGKKNSIVLVGKDASCNVAKFTFIRGGNDVNEFTIEHISIYELKKWMQNLKDDTLLGQIIMPGSHDSGMSRLHHSAPPEVGDIFTKTQNLTVEEQLKAGARYFDIRVDYDYKELVTYHRTDVGGFGWGANGQSLKDVFDETSTFLHCNPKELAIFKISHIRSAKGHDANSTKEKIDNFLKSYEACLYCNDDESIKLSNVQLGQFRGKIILLFDYKEHINTSKGSFFYSTNFNLYDSYSNTQSYSKMKDDQLDKWRKKKKHDNDLFLLSWTLTPKPPFGESISEMARNVNAKLPDDLNHEIMFKHGKNPNVVYIDFINEFSCQCIIYHNWMD